MRVQTLEASRVRTRPAHTEVELGPQLPLLCVRALEARAELRVLGGGATPALDAARRLGYIRPGEHLFIVKGIKAWERANSKIAGGDGK